MGIHGTSVGVEEWRRCLLVFVSSVFHHGVNHPSPSRSSGFHSSYDRFPTSFLLDHQHDSHYAFSPFSSFYFFCGDHQRGWRRRKWSYPCGSPTWWRHDRYATSGRSACRGTGRGPPLYKHTTDMGTKDDKNDEAQQQRWHAVCHSFAQCGRLDWGYLPFSTYAACGEYPYLYEPSPSITSHHVLHFVLPTRGEPFSFSFILCWRERRTREDDEGSTWEGRRGR